MTEFDRNVSEFDVLEQKVSSKLLENDGVYALVAEQLTNTSGVEDLPDFKVRPYYGSARIEEAGLDPNTTIPMSLQIEYVGAANAVDLPELGPATKRFTHVQLGAMAANASKLHLYDEFGRLHAIDRGEHGFELSDSDGYDVRRADAASAWLLAHGTMMRAEQQNPDIHLDFQLGAWTDTQHHHPVV